MRVGVKRAPAPSAKVAFAQERLQGGKLARIADDVTVDLAGGAAGGIHAFDAGPGVKQRSHDCRSFVCGGGVGKAGHQFLQAAAGVARHCLVQAVHVAEALQIGQLGDGVADGHQILVDGAGGVGGEPDVVDGMRVAVGAGVLARLQMLVALGVG